MRKNRGRIFKSLYIDGSFLFHHAQSIKERIDFKKLKSLFTREEGDYLVCAAYYTALPSDSEIEEKHRRFIRILKKEVRVKVKSVPLLKINGSAHNSEFNPRYSKGEDILLACDMVRGAALNMYDEAILISGDGDFIPAVRMVQELGKRVTIAAFRDSLNRNLDIEASDIIYLDDYLEEIRLVDDFNQHHQP